MMNGLCRQTLTGYGNGQSRRCCESSAPSSHPAPSSASETPSMCAPPTSILAPENGFNITQMIKCKLQQHHPGTLICSFYPYSGLILHADTSGTIVFGVSLGLVWERVLSYLAYTLCTKPKAQPESQPWLGQPKSTKPQELSLLHG